jgi:hypothetical protein
MMRRAPAERARLKALVGGDTRSSAELRQKSGDGAVKAAV